MNIAIIAPSPVPFAMGGAENLWIGLQNSINSLTNYKCELLKIPTKEQSLIDVIRSYKAFASFNAKHFDQIITGKYPAWMVEHDSHVLYMLHKLRGLYDTYHMFNMPTDFTFGGEFSAIKKSMDILESCSFVPNEQIVDFLNEIEFFILKKCVDESKLQFPGPFARAIVHCLDNIALRPYRISKYAAISKNISHRRNYFPEGVIIDIIYPPPLVDHFYCHGDEYLFTVSRLDGSKRLDLLIKAMGHVRADIPLLIAGDGPEEVRLRELAGNDKRIEFLGRVTDEQLISYYADALAVPFIPYDEDYGLVTIEAMKSGKPVITTNDSGGVLEFVENHETGLVVSPEPKAIAEAIEYMCCNRNKAREMGARARKRVENITWDNLVNQLLSRDVKKPKSSRIMKGVSLKKSKPKAVLAVTFPIYPPRGGGQARIYHLYRELAKEIDITIVSLTNSGEPSYIGEIGQGLREIRVPKSHDHEKMEIEYSQKVGWTPVTDIIASSAIHLTPNYLAELKLACDSADIVIASHPYLGELLLNNASHAEFWFEAQDVELDLKSQILSKFEGGDALIEMVRKCEDFCWKTAKLTYTCTACDLAKLESLYGHTDSFKFVVPNGFDADSVRFVSLESRRFIKQLVGLGNRPVAIFMGSWHEPNIEAIERIIGYAALIPHVLFVLIGSAGLKFVNHDLPENVRIFGPVDEPIKAVLLSMADLAINPMTSGSGSNLKMMDYLAAGLPVLTTQFGVRGFALEPGQHYIVADLDNFMVAISEFFINRDDKLLGAISESAAKFVKDKYAWSIIAKKALAEIRACSAVL